MKSFNEMQNLNEDTLHQDNHERKGNAKGLLSISTDNHHRALFYFFYKFMNLVIGNIAISIEWLKWFLLALSLQLSSPPLDALVNSWNPAFLPNKTMLN